MFGKGELNATLPYMKKIAYIPLLVCLSLTSGCAALKETTGDYIIEAVTKQVSEKIEDQLNDRGLSLKELQELTDGNGDGSINMAEIRSTVKDMAKDFIILQGQQLVEGKVNEYATQFVSASDLDNHSKSWWLALLGTFGTVISTYLGKQVYSAKKDGKRDERIAVLEKLLQRDIDGDGQIGTNGKPVQV